MTFWCIRYDDISVQQFKTQNQIGHPTSRDNFPMLSSSFTSALEVLEFKVERVRNTKIDSKESQRSIKNQPKQLAGRIYIHFPDILKLLIFFQFSFWSGTFNILHLFIFYHMMHNRHNAGHNMFKGQARLMLSSITKCNSKVLKYETINHLKNTRDMFEILVYKHTGPSITVWGLTNH